MSERKRKSFTSQHKAKVALEAIRGVKTANEIVTRRVITRSNPEGQVWIWTKVDKW